jgi:hypothetical protein
MNVHIYQWAYKRIDLFFSLSNVNIEIIFLKHIYKISWKFFKSCVQNQIWVYGFSCSVSLGINQESITNLYKSKLSQVPTITLNFYCRHFATTSVNNEEDGWNLVRWFFINVSIIHVQNKTCKLEDQFLWEREGKRWMIRNIIHRCKIIPNAFFQIGLIWILFNFLGEIP